MVSQHDQNSSLILKTHGSEIISRQEKRIFTTGYFNDALMMDKTQWNYISCYHWKCQKWYMTNFHPYTPAIK